MVNKTQISFKENPEQWGPELYRLLGQTIDAINDNILPAISDLEDRMAAAEASLELLKQTIQ